MEASAETEWPILLQHGKPRGFSTDFAGSEQNFRNFPMQLLRQNQESFSSLKHYRPFRYNFRFPKSLPRTVILLAGSITIAPVSAQANPANATEPASNRAQCMVSALRGPENARGTADVGNLSNPTDFGQDGFQKMVDSSTGHAVWVRKADFDRVLNDHADCATSGTAAHAVSPGMASNPPPQNSDNCLVDFSQEKQKDGVGTGQYYVGQIEVSQLRDLKPGERYFLEVVTGGLYKDAEGWVSKEQLQQKRALTACQAQWAGTALLRELIADHLTLFAKSVEATTVEAGDIAIPYRGVLSDEINYHAGHIDAHVAVAIVGRGYWPARDWYSCWIGTAQGEAFIAPKTLGVGNDCGESKIAAETPAVSDQPTPSWEKRTRTDEMTHKTTSSVIRDFPFADGIVIRTLVMCGDIGANVVFAAFRANNPALFSMDKDGNSAIRVSLDGGGVHVARGEELASGKPAQFVQIVFFAPAAIKKIERNTLPNTGGLLGGLSDKIGKTMGDTAVAVVAGWAAGTLTEFASARSVRVELRLADGTADIVDLNPQDAGLNQIVTSCASHFRSSAMNTERRGD